MCRILGLTNTAVAAGRLKPNETMTVTNTYSHSAQRGGAQALTIVNEPGLYRLIFRSSKPEAERFQAWVFNEVLPQIRKTGGYRAPTGIISLDDLDLGNLAGLDVARRLVTEMRQLRGARAASALWEQLGLPTPAGIAGTPGDAVKDEVLAIIDASPNGEMTAYAVEAEMRLQYGRSGPVVAAALNSLSRAGHLSGYEARSHAYRYHRPRPKPPASPAV